MEDLDTEGFRDLAHDAVQNYGMHRLAEDDWEDFAARLSYVPQGAGPEGLTSAVKEAQSQLGTTRGCCTTSRCPRRPRRRCWRCSATPTSPRAPA